MMLLLLLGGLASFLAAVFLFIRFSNYYYGSTNKTRVNRIGHKLKDDEEGGAPSSSSPKAFAKHSGHEEIPGPALPDDIRSGHSKMIAECGGLVPFVKALHSTYGPAVTFVLPGGSRVVSINQPDLLKVTLKVGDRPHDLFRFLEPLLKPDNIQVHTASRARKIRRLFNSPVSHKLLQRRYRDVLFHGKLMLEEIKDRPNLRMQEDMLDFALTAAVAILTGLQPKPEFGNSFREHYDNALKLTFNNPLGLSAEDEKSLEIALAAIDAKMEELIIAKQEQLKTHGPSKDKEETDMLEILLTANDPETGEPFTRDRLFSYITAYILASYHTSIVALSWTVFLLTEYPDAQRRVQQEVDQVIGHPKRGDNGEWIYPEPAWEDLNKLDYSTRCIKEAMRIFTPGPFAARYFEHDFEIGKYLLPAGTTLFFPLNAIHMNEEFWPAPTRFDPDRFLTDQSSIYFAFGLGARMCPGERMAWMEMRLMLSMLMQRYTLVLDMPRKDVVPIEQFALWAKNDIVVKLNPRAHEQEL